MLHLVFTSPYASNALESALNHCVEGDALVLMQDAVLGGMQKGQWAELLITHAKQYEFHAMESDLLARGIGPDRLLKEVSPLDYAGLVDLTAAHNNSMSWG